MPARQRLLVILGLSMVVAGLLWPRLYKLPWGRLPGDISIERPGFSFHFPLTTSLVISVVLTLLIWWLWRRNRCRAVAVPITDGLRGSGASAAA